ncbi:hypothetical protein QAD02_019308 [Eretmocerus hayati]|uniref:Uncharacterized protein n=1 Tax=Eretmocerus hayati TaxID=131215 RepID=A0ACC2PL28_9HYME|nr:hypothetical protein QAD02_019308 [Eretmocerus hayati]
MENLTFAVFDYCVFGTLLGASLVIGIYFGFFSKQDTTTEYLFGGKKMGFFPVAVSMLASMLSGITFLGIPTETYLYGTTFACGPVSSVILGLMSTYLFLPVFFKLQLSSSNEYLELRFSKDVRRLSSVVYMIGMLAYISVIIYVPALAFSQVTNFSVHTITPLLTLICITYTSLGGIKAVIWTDTFQFMFTLVGTFTILTVGINKIGGISEVWRIAEAGNRTTIFNMDPSPFERSTFWAIQSSAIASSIGRFCCGQKFIQKCLSVEKERDANKSVWLMKLGWVTILYTCIIIGLVMYGRYHDCDPLKAHLVKNSDQTLVYFVLDIARHIPGIPGIFLSGLVSSSLSTMSACLNTLSGIIYDDFIDQMLPKSNNHEARAALIMKVTVVLIGLSSVALVMILERLGTIIDIINIIGSMLDAPLTAIFVLGMLIPWVGKKGALVGGYCSLISMIWLVVGSQWHKMHGRISFPHLPTSIEGCDASLNVTQVIKPMTESDGVEPFFLFRVSMFHFTTIGSIVGITIGILTSIIAQETDISKVNPDYIAPPLRRFLPKEYIEVPLKTTTKTKEDLENEKNLIYDR